MDKLKLSDVGGFPLVLDDLQFLLGRLGTPDEGIYPAFNNLLRGFGDNFIVQGVVASGTTPNVAITEGWVLLSGELIKVDAQTGIDTATDNKFVKETTFNPRGTKTFLNGSIAETYEINRALVQGTSGNLDFDGDTLIELTSGAETLPDAGRVEIKKKIIELGDWDMDITDFISVAHGLSDITKIRSQNVMIIRDDSNTISPLNLFTDGVGLEGGIGTTIGANVQLSRRTGGIYDSTLFNSTGFNRGFLTIEFEA